MNEALFERRQILKGLADERNQSCERDVNVAAGQWLPLRFAPFRYYTPRGENCVRNDYITDVIRIIAYSQFVCDCAVDWDHLCIMISFKRPQDLLYHSSVPIWSSVIPYELDQNFRILLSKDAYNDIMEKIGVAWKELESGFRRSVQNQHCFLIGRAGSPQEHFTNIPSFSWENYEIISWRRGTAKCFDTDETIFSLHISQIYGKSATNLDSGTDTTRKASQKTLSDLVDDLKRWPKVQKIVSYLYDINFTGKSDIMISATLREDITGYINEKEQRNTSSIVDFKQTRKSIEYYNTLKNEFDVMSLESIGIQPFPIERGRKQP